MGTRSSLWPAWLTFVWGVLCGGLNLWWSLGGDFLLERMGVRIQEEAAAGDTTLLVINTIGGLGKIAIGLLALGTISRWGRRIPRRLSLALLYTGGVLLVLYGGANWTQMLLVELGVVEVPASIGADPLRWYLLLWEPVWIVGGVLMVLTAEAYRRRV
jgi:hypothetical protein